MNFYNVAHSIFHYALCLDDISILQTHFSPYFQPKILLVCLFSKVFSLYINLSTERHLSIGHRAYLWVVLCFKPLFLPFRIVSYHHLHWVEHCHHSVRFLVQVFAYTKLQKRYIYKVLSLGYPYRIRKFAYRLRGITTPAHPRDRGHTRVIPAGYIFLIY